MDNERLMGDCPAHRIAWPTMGQGGWQGHEGAVYDLKGEFRVIDCESCGFKHIVPIPTVDELSATYKHDYYETEKPLYLDRHKEDLDWWNAEYDERYDFLESQLSPGRRRLLDVGSGPGYFLLRGEQRGWTVHGVEPSRQAAEHSRAQGLTIAEEFLSRDLLNRLGRFDAVHTSEVLEHIPDPRGFLEIVHECVEPGGLLCVSVPNDYNPLQYTLRKTCNYDSWWVAPPHHINYFDYDSIASLLRKVGFEILCQAGTFPMEIFLLMGENYVGNDTLGRDCHGRRKAFELAFRVAGMEGFKAQLGQAYARCGIGRTVVTYARRI